MKEKKFVLILIAMVLVFSLSIAIAGTRKEKISEKDMYNVAFSNVWEGNTWGVQSKAEFYAEVDRQKAAGRVNNVYYTNADFNAEKQVSDLEDLLTKDIGELTWLRRGWHHGPLYHIMSGL